MPRVYAKLLIKVGAGPCNGAKKISTNAVYL